MTFTVPDYGADTGYNDIGVYAPRPAISHAITAPYHSFKHDSHFEVNSGWISLPIAYNNSASAAQDHTVRIKLHHPQYYKVVDYAATRQSRPPMVPDIENTNHDTLDPVITITNATTGQQPPVLHDMTFVSSCPLSTASGEAATFKTSIRAKYSVAKEKLYFDAADATESGISSSAKVQYLGKAPNDGNTRKVPLNVTSQYTFSASVGPGFLEGAYVRSSVGPNTATALNASYNSAYQQTRYELDHYKGA